MHSLSMDECRWCRYRALYLCQPRHKNVYRQVSWLCNVHVQCGLPRIYLMLPKHPSNSSSQPAPEYHCQWSDQWVRDEIASSLMQLDIFILKFINNLSYYTQIHHPFMTIFTVELLMHSNWDCLFAHTNAYYFSYFPQFGILWVANVLPLVFMAQLQIMLEVKCSLHNVASIFFPCCWAHTWLVVPTIVYPLHYNRNNKQTDKQEKKKQWTSRANWSFIHRIYSIILWSHE